MKFRTAILIFSLAAVPATAFAASPSETVMKFYAPVGYEADPALRSLFVEPALTILKKNDKMTDDTGEVGCIDFGLAIDAQDFDQGEVDKSLKLKESVQGDSAEVTATLSIFPDEPDSKREIIWSLKNVGGEWKVANIRSATNDWDMSKFECE